MKAVQTTYGNIDIVLGGETPSDAVVHVEVGSQTLYLTRDEFDDLRNAARLFGTAVEISFQEHQMTRSAVES